MRRWSRCALVFEHLLNDMGIPESAKAINGGPVPNYIKNYGSWLRRANRNAFRKAQLLFRRGTPWPTDLLCDNLAHIIWIDAKRLSAVMEQR